MSLNDYNKKAITDIYKNAQIALQSISDLIPEVDDKQMKDELNHQYEGYENVIAKISAFMKQADVEIKDINPFKKAMMWSSIKMKTLVNNSINQIADMMIKGSIMGINELTAMKNEQSNLDENVKLLLDELLQLENDYLERLKKFL